MPFRLKLTTRICTLFSPRILSGDLSPDLVNRTSSCSLSTSRLPLVRVRFPHPVRENRDHVPVEVAYPRLDLIFRAAHHRVAVNPQIRRQRLGLVPNSGVHHASYSPHAASASIRKKPSALVRAARPSTGKPTRPVRDFPRTLLV